MACLLINAEDESEFWCTEASTSIVAQECHQYAFYWTFIFYWVIPSIEYLPLFCGRLECRLSGLPCVQIFKCIMWFASQSSNSSCILYHLLHVFIVDCNLDFRSHRFFPHLQIDYHSLYSCHESRDTVVGLTFPKSWSASTSFLAALLVANIRAAFFRCHHCFSSFQYSNQSAMKAVCFSSICK